MSAAPASTIATIERELAALWSAPEEPGALPKTRVCTMNLVVVAESPRKAERYTTVVDEVTATTPARALVIAVHPETPGDALTGSATAVCALDEGRQVCSERVRLDASADAADRLPSALDALLVPELPTVLVWVGPVNAADPLFVAAAARADRVVIDSEYSSFASTVELATWAASAPHTCIVDLAWVRLASWQELCARMFDDAPHRPLVDCLEAVEIEQASGEGAALGSEAALLLGWLSARLGWVLSARDGNVHAVRADGAPIDVRVRAVGETAGVAPCVLARVQLRARLGATVLKSCIDRKLGTGLATATLDADVIEWCNAGPDGEREGRIRLGANKAAKWLERALHRPAADRLLMAAIGAAAPLASVRVSALEAG